MSHPQTINNSGLDPAMPDRVRWSKLQHATLEARILPGRSPGEPAGSAPTPIGLSPQPAAPSAAKSFVAAMREHGSLLAEPEKRALIWLARRLPSWVQPDHLTLLGLTALIMAGAGYWLARWNPLFMLGSIACLGLNWFGDSLDGTLARTRNRQRPRYGFYVDHVCDTFGMAALIGGLGLSGYMSFPMALALLVAYYIVSIEVYLATYALAIFRLSFLRCGPTELRLLLAGGTLALMWHPTAILGGKVFLLCDVAAAFAIVGLIAAAAVSTCRNTRALYLQERLP